MAHAAKSIEISAIGKHLSIENESERRKMKFKQAFAKSIQLVFRTLVLFFEFFFQPELKKSIGPNQPSRQVYAPRWDRDLY